MSMIALEALVAAAAIVGIALVARQAQVVRDRKQLSAPITETQARENAAPLSTAILGSERRPSPKA